jgi:hypothetical protein
MQQRRTEGRYGIVRNLNVRQHSTGIAPTEITKNGHGQYTMGILTPTNNCGCRIVLYNVSVGILPVETLEVLRGLRLCHLRHRQQRQN